MAGQMAWQTAVVGWAAWTVASMAAYMAASMAALMAALMADG